MLLEELIGDTHIVPCSRLFIYYNAKAKIHKDMGPVDYGTGISIRAACKSVEQYGACVESLFPYQASSLRGHPSTGSCRLCVPVMLSKACCCLLIRCAVLLHAAAQNDAMARKKVLKVITMFSGPNSDPREKIYTILSALSRGHPIMVGLQ